MSISTSCMCTSSTVPERCEIWSFWIWLSVVLVVVTVTPVTSLRSSKWPSRNTIPIQKKNKACQYIKISRRSSSSSSMCFANNLNDNFEFSVVTGANGYLGRHIVHQLLLQKKERGAVLCLVRPSKVMTEIEFWNSILDKRSLSISVPPIIMPYDMLDGGVTLEKSIQWCLDHCAVKGHPVISATINLFHTASIFGPTKTPVETAKQNVQGIQDTIQTLARVIAAATAATSTLLHAHLILTSSMAAVRGPGQQPSNKSYFTSRDDWNTISTCNADSSWGMCYQWSKMYGERLAWKQCDDLGIPMTAICPSFIIGPLLSGSLLECNLTSLPYSLELIKSWLEGDSPVQSRLFVDVRDVAAAHIAAAAIGGHVDKNNHFSKYRPRRYLVSTERRIPAQVVAHTLLKTMEQEQELKTQQQPIPNKKQMYCDDKFDGGSIPIGQVEVLTSDMLRDELGVTCRPIKESLIDTVQQMLFLLNSKETVIDDQ